MLKAKYLHRKSRPSSDNYWLRKKEKNCNLFYDDLPMHESIRRSFNYSNYDTTPLVEFIKSKIGKDWNDVYSEILKKIKKKYRHNIDYCITWFVHITPIYDKDFIPRDNRGRILDGRLFIDKNNILVCKTEEELLIESKQLKRREKLKKILENLEKIEKEN